MEKVIVDIGSGKTKSFIVDEDNQITPLYAQRIRLKEGYSKITGLNPEDKICLFDTINKIKAMAEGRSIHIYATSVFRTMNAAILNEFVRQFENATGLEFNIVSSEYESELMTKSVGRLDLDDAYLVLCIGNGSTEMNVMKNGVVVESVNIEFARADFLVAFPELKNPTCNIELSELEKFVKTNMKFPQLKSDYAIILGFNNLSKSRALNFELANNQFFNNSAIPMYLDYQQFTKETINLLKSTAVENDTDIFRAHCVIVKCILESVQAKYCFPTDLNMINGIVQEFGQAKANAQVEKNSGNSLQ